MLDILACLGPDGQPIEGMNCAPAAQVDPEPSPYPAIAVSVILAIAIVTVIIVLARRKK